MAPSSAGRSDVVLVGYNFSMGSELDAAIDRAKAAGIGVVAMKVMAGGFRRPQPGDKTQETLKRDEPWWRLSSGC